MFGVFTEGKEVIRLDYVKNEGYRIFGVIYFICFCLVFVYENVVFFIVGKKSYVSDKIGIWREN